MDAKEFLEMLDYFDTNVKGQKYEEMGIYTLSDLIEEYHKRKLNAMYPTEAENWTSVKDKLPEHETDVVTFSKEFEVRNGRCYGGKTWFVNGYYLFRKNTPTLGSLDRG